MSAQYEKIALFIDGANLYTTAKSLGLDIDYKRLLREFQSGGHLLRAFYYTAVFDDQESVSIRPLIDWLEYNGYTVVTKAAKELVDHSGRRKVKGNMDIELAVDAMEIGRTSTEWCCFPAMAIFARLFRRCSGGACASSSSPACRRSRQWSLRNCVARLMSSSTSKRCKTRSAAIQYSGRHAIARRHNLSSARPAPRSNPRSTNSTRISRFDPGLRLKGQVA
jgi:hypothetical protein